MQFIMHAIKQEKKNNTYMCFAPISKPKLKIQSYDVIPTWVVVKYSQVLSQ